MTVDTTLDEYTPKALRAPKQRAKRRLRCYAVMIELAADPLGAGGIFGPHPTIDECLEYVPDASATDAGRVAIYQLGGPDPTDVPVYEWVVSRRCWRRLMDWNG